MVQGKSSGMGFFWIIFQKRERAKHWVDCWDCWNHEAGQGSGDTGWGQTSWAFKKKYAQEAECRFAAQEAGKGGAQVVERKSFAQVEERGSFSN